MGEIIVKSEKRDVCWSCVFLKYDGACQRPSRQGTTVKYIIANPITHDSCEEYIESPYLIKESAG